LKNLNNNRNKYNPVILLTLLLSLTLFVNDAYSQAEVEPWGNITGIRKDGQLFEFQSFINVKRDTIFHSTAKEKQRPHYKRNGDEQIVTTNIDSLFIKETVKDLSPGKIKVTVNLNAHADMDSTSIYYCIVLPPKDYAKSRLRLLGVKDELKKFVVAGPNYDDNAKGVEFKSSTRNLELKFDDPTHVLLRKDTSDGKNDNLLFIALKLNNMHKGDTTQTAYTITAGGDVDKEPVDLTIDTSKPGRAFDGLGGNFRLQNPKTDQQVIDYSLQNLRVAYSRVEMPWRFWQPDKDVDPTASADSGKLHPSVQKAIQMAHRLDSLGIPIILSAWFPPNWAITGKMNFRPVNGVWGNPLNKDNMDAIYKSIADYILYLKNKYGFEPKLFSFNESDLGINIRLTAQDHDNFIKGCGAYFATHGVTTKMLLGDNSDANTYKFIYPAMDDPDAKQYIGAISFHSWRGWDTNTLQKWADAATRLKVPLLVGEGSIDAAAYSYPDIFQEQTYALQEINLYTRLLAICQPLSILQWQLTADYSPLIGGSIFGNDEPLHPGQRFWNLKQLSITPKGLFAMPISCNRPDISCAALGNNDKGTYALHLVNNGATRKVILKGLPASVKSLQIYTTSKQLNMKQDAPIKVNNGQATFKIDATSFTTLISE
jgi:hypothetical protein